MKITVYYEDKNNPTILDVPDVDCEIWIEEDYQRRLSAVEDKSTVTRRTAQEIMDEDFNKPTFNSNQTETRRHVHLDALDPEDKHAGHESINGRGIYPPYALHRVSGNEFWNTIQLIFTAIGGWLGYFLGGCDGLLIALVAFVIVDYITGVMCAVADKNLSSEVGFKGIAKKVLIFLLVGIANILDVQVIGTGSVLRTAVIFFYISNEGVSLTENAAHLGLPIPEKLKAVLEQLHNWAETENSDKEDE